MSGFSIFLSILIIVFIIYMGSASKPNSSTGVKIRNDNEEEVIQRLSNIGEIKHVMMLNDNMVSNNKEFVAIVDDILYYELHDNKGFTSLENVRETDISYHVKERNQMKIMSITPTFDKTTILQRIGFTLYKENEDDVKLIFRGFCVTPQKAKKLKLVIDKMIAV